MAGGQLRSQALPGPLFARNTRFHDGQGRHVILRGINFAPDSKMPSQPNGHSYLPSDFSDHRTVSFIGRPAPLDDLDTHLTRLRHWGFNGLRLLTTWEAVEHAGPGQHDTAYLDYFAEVCRRAGAHGFRVFIDFHQDVWSRMSGGSGAPGWTFEAAGLDFTRFHAADAAHVMQHNYDPAIGGHQDSYPSMSWSSNYRMPANGIMWTLFFAGQDFAPSCTVDGENVQSHLQRHYLGAMRAVAERVAKMAHVIGFDTLNEPGTGYIGRRLDEAMTRYRGEAWTPLDGLAVASGVTRTIPVLALGGRGTEGEVEKNAAGLPIWLPGREDPFMAGGAWGLVDGVPTMLKPDYFVAVGGRRVELERDYMAPFFGRVAQTIRSVREDWLVFAETEPFDALSGPGLPAQCPERTVNAPHWYDVSALATKRFDPERMPDILFGGMRRGRQAIEDGYVEQLAKLKSLGERLAGGAPTLVGECGIPFDMNGREAYRRWAAGERDPSIWSAQTSALELLYNALDRLLLSSTQWNYTVENRNDPMVGDGWNQEDLSIWSPDQATHEGDPDSGGRAVEGFCRPYVRAAQGVLLRQAFDRAGGCFEAEIDVDARIGAPTEIYVPRRQFPGGFDCDAGAASTRAQGQLLFIASQTGGRLLVRITRRGRMPRARGAISVSAT